MSRPSIGGWKLLVLPLVTALLSAGCGSPAQPDVTTTLTVPTSTGTIPESTTASSSTSTTTGPTTTTTTSTATATSTTTTVPAPSTSLPPVEAAAVVTLVATSEQVVALTFDAGSDRGFAAEILDTLAAHGIGASFGMTGTWAESNPDLVRRMAEEGHALINHTYDHPHMETLSTEQRLLQLARTEEIITEITGTTTKPYFRPPYGSYNNQVLIDVASAGYRYSVMWTVDCLGWKGLPPSEVAARCENALQPGAILLMHVGAASTDYAALDEIIAAIDRGGYRYATIPELLP
jgi:peptidoglycan/xylan/chitin deacetylase (PgdA/CDA1 family)